MQVLTLDISKENDLNPLVIGRIGDGEILKVRVNVTDNGVAFDFSDSTLTFEGVTHDYKSKIFDSKGIKVINGKAGVFEYSFPNPAFGVVGRYETAYFSFTYNKTKRATTSNFELLVLDNADITAEEAKTIITEYNRLIEELRELQKKNIAELQKEIDETKAKINDLNTKLDQINKKIDATDKKADDVAKKVENHDVYTKPEADAKFATIQSLANLSNKVIANKGNLASGTDLDNVIDIGTYRIGGLTGETDVINVPSELSGTAIYAYLTVSGTTASVVQELIIYASSTGSKIYSRSRYGSTPTFNPWSKTVKADDSGKVTIKDLVVTGTIQQTLSVNQSIAVGWGRTLNFTRIGNVVTVTGEGTFATTMPQGAWQSAGETLPVGFRPLSRQTTRASAITNVNKFMWTRFNTDGSIQHWQNGSIVVTDTMIMNGTSWVTADPFPTA